MPEKLHLLINILQPVATEIIAIVAILGFFNTRWLWKQTNRPIVSAFVETHSAGNVATMFNFIIVNTGNRPAIDIKLTIDNKQEFKECIANPENEMTEYIFGCFENSAIIPLLIDGEKRSNSFGLTSIKKEQNIWKYGSSFSITINYKDLEKKQYQSKLSLYIKDSESFAGSSWKESN
ncbi:MAG: hypothetical protein Tsb0014_20490 [Pleurocapsa sp.]